MNLKWATGLGAITLAATLGLTACSSAESPAESSPDVSAPSADAPPSPSVVASDATASDSSWDEVKASGVLKSCAADGLLPYSASTGPQRGLEVEMADALAERMGVANETVWVGTWDGLIPSLDSGQCDAIIAGLFITEERKAVVDFTDPTWGSGEVMLVRKDDDSVTALSDLANGRCVGALQGSVTVDVLKEKGIEPRIYPSQNEVILDVANGGCDAAYLESPSAGWALQQEADLNLKIVEGDPADQVLFYEGIALRRGDNALRDQLNAAIAEIQQDGTLGEILTSYGIPVFLPNE